MLSFMLVVVWLAVAGASTLWGLEYYLLSPEARAFSPMARLFAPTGLVGQGFGVVGTAMLLVGVVGYSLRKRLAVLSRAGELRVWLEVHIFLCTLGPYLVLLHTTFKFGGLVAVAFWSMAIVVASGVFGRYVYVRIPKTINGGFLGMEEIRGRVGELAEQLRRRSGLGETRLADLLGDVVLEDGGAAALRAGGTNRVLPALAMAVRDDLRGRWRALTLSRELRREGVPGKLRRDVVGLVRERDRLHRQTLVLRPFQRLFRYWHVVHLPLAIVMLLVLAVHVTVAILFGYTWIF